MNAPALLEALSAAGVTVALNAAGDGLALSGRGQPPAALLEEVRASKAALLAALAPRPGARPSWTALAALPGHCGTCARWSARPAPLAHMGLCSAGRRLHGWLDGNPAGSVELQAGHACAVQDGNAWYDRGVGKPLSAVTVSV